MLDHRFMIIPRTLKFMIALPLSAAFLIAASVSHAPADPAFPRTGYATSGDGITLRAEPSQQGRKLAVIPLGEAVRVVSETGDKLYLAGTFGRWTELEWKGNKGWAFGGQLTAHDPCVLKKAARELILTKYPVRQDLPPEKSEKGIVAIRSILGDFAIVERDRFDTEGDGLIYIPYLMKYHGGAWALMEELAVHEMRGGEMKLFHLDKDGYPDVYTSQGCCGNYVITFYRSDNKGLVTRLADFDLNGDRCASSDVRTGLCGETVVTCISPSGKKEIQVFDCDKNSFVKSSK